jgi:XTP/dITP diphosphohydrolase
MVTLVIATRNAHKVGEIRAILGESFRYLTLNDFPAAPEVVEDAGSFVGNATKKAVALAKWLAADQGRNRVSETLGKPQGNELYVLADDSGLEVDALRGAPGVHSARFAALDTGGTGNSPSADNNAKLLHLLAGTPAAERTARFRCVIALAPVLASGQGSASPVCYADGGELQTEVFEGACEGQIISALRGHGGFGYDPLFMPIGYDRTFGELDEGIKNELSHRARALAAVRAKIMG